jgi:hypothetical protein
MGPKGPWAPMSAHVYTYIYIYICSREPLEGTDSVYSDSNRQLLKGIESAKVLKILVRIDAPLHEETTFTSRSGYSFGKRIIGALRPFQRLSIMYIYIYIYIYTRKF